MREILERGEAMKRHGYLVALLLVAIVITGCTVTVSNYGSVVGYVYVPEGSQPDVLSMDVEPLILSSALAPDGYEPVVDAIVRLGGQIRETEYDGRFHFPSVPTGKHVLTVTHEALRFEVKKTITVRAGSPTYVGDLYGGIGYYVVIGIGEYPGLTIPGSVANAERVYQTLFAGNRLAGLGQLLLDSNATKAKIKASIDRAKNLAESGDYLVIYFSGRSGKDYLSTSGDNQSDWSKAITDGELETWVRGFPGSVTLIIDGSESSSMADGDAFYPAAFKEPEYTVISAAGPDDFVFWDEYLESSVFTHFLVKGLTGTYPADFNHNRDITAYELYQYIFSEMDDYLWGDPDHYLPAYWGPSYKDSVIFRY